jgi:hypothetical protein
LPGQEVIHQPDEITGPLDLGPVTAPPEDMQLRPVDQVQQPERGVQRDYLVIAAVDDQRLLVDLAELIVGDDHLVHAALPRRREHRRECLLEARLDARLVADPGEPVVVRQLG